MDPLVDSTQYALLYPNIILFCVSLVFCAIFSFLETCITSMRLFKIKELAQTTKRYQSLFRALELYPHRMLITILIVTALANVAAAMASAEIMNVLSVNLPTSVGFLLNIFLTTFAILIFGEILPKNIAKVYGDRFFKSTLWITNTVYYLFYPFVTFLVRISDFVVYRLGDKTQEGMDNIASEKEIQFLIEYINEKGLIEEEKTMMLKSIFELGNTGVKEIMVPAPDVVAINVDTSIKDALEKFSKYQFSRFPVYEGDTENIIGMLHLKDLFSVSMQQKEPSIKSIVRPILFMPESVKVNQLLKEFKQQHKHIAMVLDEHGNIIGMVTLEDVLEEIVGEIHDEHERITEKMIPLKPGGWLVDASIELDDLEKEMGIVFETEDALTLAGFLTERMQHLPKKGERIFYKNYHFQVQQSTLKKVLQVLIFSDTMPDILEITD